MKFKDYKPIKNIVSSKKICIVISIFAMLASVGMVIISFLVINNYSDFVAIVLSSLFTSILVALIVFTILYNKLIKNVKNVFIDKENEYEKKEYKFIENTNRKFICNYITYNGLFFEGDDGKASLMLTTKFDPSYFKNGETYTLYIWKGLITGVEE